MFRLPEIKNSFLKNKFNHLLVVVLMLFIATPFLQAKGDTVFSPAVSIVYTIMVLVILSTIIHNRKHLFFYAGLKIFSLTLDMFVFYEMIHVFEYQIHMFDFSLRIFFVGLFIFDLIKDVFFTKNITADTIKGFIVIYIFVGILWAMLYKLTYEINAAAFSSSIEKHWSFFYFSFSTLFSIGYGDIAPVSSFAMMLTSLEGLIGRLFLFIVLVKLITSNYFRSEADNQSNI